jgi:type VI protein secretion system component Hcp
MRALYGAAIIVTVLIVAGSGQALAGSKGGGGGGGGHVSTDGPKSNTSLHYGKIENTYKPQKDDGTLPSVRKTGSGSKVHFNEFTIKKTFDKASTQ